ncbi:MAG: cysteine--tRNA ligase [Candidatus Micrarchaeota archaeon]|nr:cysteine--tRNA ligase [Candidatus Micrarchaeota archaeon]
MVEGPRLYNSLTRREERFVPAHDDDVRFFVCGQTVYDDAHLGHAKSYVNFDVVVRWLRCRGYKVRYIQNITDVDDKIIARAKERGEEPVALARRYEERFLEDMERIGVRKNVDMYPRSHDYIKQIAEQIGLLVKKGYAYSIGQDIYFDVAKFKDYTKLSGMKLEELEKHRIEAKEGKRHAYDFALWKEAKEEEPSWKIAVEENGVEKKFVGRPGWHIEDTAMSVSIFGEQYDLHGGARELIFPHHTNEIAQAEAAYGKRPFVKYWIHSGILSVNGEKMSKSLGNFITIREILKDYSSETLRLFVCSTQYAKDIDYNERAMSEAKKRLAYINSSLSIFYNAKELEEDKESDIGHITEGLWKEFRAAMDGDFNTPLALSSIIRAVEKLRAYAEMKGGVGKLEKEHALSRVLECASVLGLLEDGVYRKSIPKEASALIKERERLRSVKDFGKADAIRTELKAKYNIGIEDSEYGTVWYYV